MPAPAFLTRVEKTHPLPAEVNAEMHAMQLLFGGIDSHALEIYHGFPRGRILVRMAMRQMREILGRFQSYSDEELIARIAQGDATAMEVLYARHNLKLFRFLMRLTRNRSSAEDILADVFLDVWRKAGSFQHRSSLPTWLCSLARNKAYSLMRAKRTESLEELADDSDGPEVVAQKGDKSRLLKAIISQLTVDHREIIDLVYYQEMTVAEVSKVLDVAESTVKTRMFYARRKLSELLSAAGIDKDWP